MGGVNKRIIVGTVVLMAAGGYRLLVMHPDPGQKRTATVTRVIVGGYVLAIVASVVDLVGGPASQLAGLLLALAVTTAAYAIIPDLFSRLGNRPSAAGAAATNGGGSAGGF